VVRERSGRYTPALRWYGRALRDARALEDADRVRAVTDLALDYAGVRYRQGRHRECVRWARQAVDAATEIADRRAVAHASYLLDISLSALGDPDVTRWRGAAVPIFSEIGDQVGLGNALNNMGVAAYFEGRWAEALELYRRSHAARERCGDVVGAATQLNNIAEILSDQGHSDEAVALFEEALSVWRAARYPVGVAVATGNLGRAKARADRHDDAATLLAEAVSQFSELGARSFVLESRLRQVENLVLRGCPAEALAAAGDVRDALARGEGEGPQAAVLGRLVGWALLRRGRRTEAVAALRDAVEQGERLDARFEVAVTRLALAEALGEEGGAEERRRAEQVLDELGVVSVPAVP